MKDHAIRLSDHPFVISVTPAPSLAVDAMSAERIARTEAAKLGWPVKSPSSVLLTFGRTWEIAFQIAMDLDGVVLIDAATGHVVSATTHGGF